MQISQYSVIKSHKIYIIIFNLFSVIVLNYLLLFLLSFFSIDYEFFKEYPANYFTYFLVLAILCYFATYLFYKIVYKRYFEKKKRFMEEFMQMESMKEYTGQIEDLYLDIRSFKHDYINILSSMHSYINEHNYEGLENILIRN